MESLRTRHATPERRLKSAASHSMRSRQFSSVSAMRGEPMSLGDRPAFIALETPSRTSSHCGVESGIFQSFAAAETSFPSLRASRLTVGLERVLIQAPCPIELRVRALKLGGSLFCNSSAIFLLNARASAGCLTPGAAISIVVLLAVPA